MGSEMAYNLFSKQYAKSQDAQFVVCDAVPDSARAFRDNFLSNFPGATLEVADTPAQ
jgi:3-hydroxyisobutyrate dehydrogenase